MTKHKRFHDMRGKGREQKAYSFFHAGHPFGSVPRKLKLSPIEKKPAPSAANTEGGGSLGGGGGRNGG